MTVSRRLLCLAVACLASVLPAAPGLARAVPDVRITEYVARRDLGVLPPDPDAGRTAPMAMVDGPRFVDRTDRIEARPGRAAASASASS